MAETNKVEVVISGISGVFPNSNSVDELKDVLFDKKSVITLDSRRWPIDEYGILSGVGKVNNIDRFDNVFFNMNGKLCECSETVIRFTLERAVEAIIDAGINPSELYDTNTAVFACSSGSETDTISMYDETRSGFAILGHNKAMQANRLSYVLNLNGPSFTMFSSFAGGADALVMAKQMIESGHIRTAIIAGCNLVQRPNISLQLKGLGVLTDGMETKSFSDDACGFNRAEACVALLLQNSSDARRSYGTLLSVKMEQIGNNTGIFTNYSKDYSKQIIVEAYKEAKINPADVLFVEADGYGVKDVDALELDALQEVFCTPDRKEPLKIGSIKSNIGHTDVASVFSSITKAIITMDDGYFPPNINYSKPNQDSKALMSGQIEVVTEKTPFKGDVVGINVFGRTGNYGHIVLKRHDKPKKRVYQKNEIFDDGLPRLILLSGRNEEGLKHSIKTMEKYKIDEEYIALLHNVFSKTINAHFFRSFYILPETKSREKDIYPVTLEKPPVWFVFSGMGSQWLGMGTQLLSIPVFAKAIRKCDAVMRPKGIDIFDIITNLDSTMFDNILNSFVGIAAIQIGLVDVLNAINIVPDGMVGHSVGELGCAYADGCFTAEEMMLAAYMRGRASVETQLPSGMMAAIGLGYQTIKSKLPSDIDVACHNSGESCTISGPTKSIIDFVEQLKSQNVFARSVNVSNISFHSRYIQPAGPTLFKYLRKIIPTPKPRSSKWLSTSIPEAQWDSELAATCSAEYHTNNLLSPVLFEETCKYIPKNAVVIEIAPHGLLQAIIKRSMTEAVHIPLTQRVFGDSISFLLTAIGKMYVHGLNPNISALYSSVDFPVSTGTAPLYTLCGWNHTDEWKPIGLDALLKKNRGERYVSLSPSKNSSIEDYGILGCHIIPFSTLLYYVWESLLKLKGQKEFTTPVIFQDIVVHRHVILKNNQHNEIYSTIQAGTGRFELCLDSDIIITGTVKVPIDSHDLNKYSEETKKSQQGTPQVSYNHGEIYSSFDHFNYCAGDTFKKLKQINVYETETEIDAILTWDTNWFHFLDGLLQLPTLYNMEKYGELCYPVAVNEVFINPIKMNELKCSDVRVKYNVLTNKVTAPGIVFSLVECGKLPLEPSIKNALQFNDQRVILLDQPNLKDQNDFLDVSMDLIFELTQVSEFGKITMYPIYDAKDQDLVTYTEHILKTNSFGIQLVQVDTNVKVLTSNSANSQCFAITRDEHLTNVMTLLSKQNNCHLIVLSKSSLNGNDDWTVVIQQRFGSHYLALIKKVIKTGTQSSFVTFELNSENINCSDSIQNSLKDINNTEKLICITSRVIPLNGTLSLVKQLSSVSNIRFFFVLDNSISDFTVQDPFYAKQLAKDLLLNIYLNNEWFTCKEMTITSSVMHKLADTSIVNDLAYMSLNNVDVKYIGINSQDSDACKFNDEHDLGPIEYSGLTINGTPVMGIAPYVPTLTNIKADPILSWHIPKSLSLEDAATIPLSYSMAYYVLKEICTVTKDSRVLINAGIHPASLALVAICLEEKCTLYTLVSNSEQAALLKQRFPSISNSNILYDNKDNEIKVLVTTSKLDIVINCQDGEDANRFLRLTALHGKCVFLTKNMVSSRNKMGLRKFLSDISFYVIGPNRIIEENDHTKKNIQKSVQLALNNGVIKPFSRQLFKGACTTIQARKNLETFSREADCKRVVISTSSANNNSNNNASNVKLTDEFYCYRDKIYFVVGNGTDEWLTLAEWLMLRGALKIVVALDKCSLTSRTSWKFNILLDRFNGVSVKLITQTSMNTTQASFSLLDDIVAKHELAAVFFVKNVPEKIIENMQYATEKVSAKYEQKPLFVCLMCGGAKSCEYFRAKGVNSMCLTWGQCDDKPDISKILPSLDSLLVKSEKLTSGIVVCTKDTDNQRKMTSLSGTAHTAKRIMFLPQTTDELERISEYIVDKSDFVEVTTKCTKYGHAKGAYPVFFIPGFRPVQLNSFYKNLGYPTFVARYPENIESILNVAETLIERITEITDHKSITIIGESWGGAVALLMTQLLESKGLMVSLTLLDGVPYELFGSFRNLLLNSNFNSKLLSKFLPTHAVANSVSSLQEWKMNLPKILQSCKISSANKVYKSLNVLRSQLRSLLDLKPLSNKILSRVNIFTSNEPSESNITMLEEYCANVPILHVHNNPDEQNILNNPEIIDIINENVAFYYPYSLKKPLDVAYNDYYYYAEVQLVV
ncbi:fatty acid synthase-like [Adelges cooleyi]|uniref:fatty acid synthase-like n=1 Tax=Adelges cooleyi TaxID=133065 RepID=UPI00218033CA|nr:fatty acid synthase-like [Adelges cooleyi]